MKYRKLVINNCYGGFSVTKEVLEESLRNMGYKTKYIPACVYKQKLPSLYINWNLEE